MKEKQTFVQNLAFMAFMAAINMVFSLVATVFPFASLFLMIALPMASVMVVLVCKEKYYPIYAAATLLLSFLVTFNGPGTTLFYLLPSLLSGFLFGFLIKRHVFSGWIILAASCLELGVSYVTMLLINALYETDMVAFFARLFAMDQSPFVGVIMPTFFFVLALAQSTFCFIIIQSETKKFGFRVQTEISDPRLLSWSTFAPLPLMILGGFVAPWLSYLMLPCFIFFSLYSFILVWPKRTLNMVIIWGISEFLTLFLFAAVFDWVQAPLSLLFIGLFFLPSDVLCLVSFYLKKDHKTIK